MLHSWRALNGKKPALVFTFYEEAKNLSTRDMKQGKETGKHSSGHRERKTHAPDISSWESAFLQPSGSQLGVIFPPCPRAIKQCLERLYFDCHNWWGRGVHYWYLAGRGHGCCLSIRQCTDQPHNKEISSPNCQLCQH